MLDEIKDLLENNPKILSKMNALINKISVDNMIKEKNITSLKLNEKQLSILYYLIDERNIEIVSDNELEYNADDSIRTYLNEIKNIPILSVEEEKELAIKSSNGDQEARQKLVQANLRLVVFIAKRYKRKGIDFLDLIQEGNVGLIKGIDKFDLSKGCRISTYVTYWIIQVINRYVEANTSSVSVSSHAYNKFIRLEKTRDRLYNELNRKPTYQELADNTNLSIDKIKELEIDYPHSDISLETEMIKGTDNVLKDTISDENSTTFIDELEQLDLQQKIITFIDSSLNERNKDIIKKRWGIGYDRDFTMQEIANEYGISRQRVDQLEKRTLERLRKQIKSKGVAKTFEEHIDITTDVDVKNKFLRK